MAAMAQSLRSREGGRGAKRRNPTRSSHAAKDDKLTTQLIIQSKYINELPKPPVPKLLKAMPSAERLYRYRPTDLELDCRPVMLTEKDMMARIELVDPDAYGPLTGSDPMGPPPPPCDAQLLRDNDISEEDREAQTKRLRLEEPTEAWHREGFPFQFPQLLTNDLFVERQRFTTGTFAAEKKIERVPPYRPSPEDLAAKIEKTFEDATKPPVHPTKPGMKAKRVLPIVPDAVLWANKYRQVVFDELPEKTATQDLLFKTVPTARATCFGYFSQDTAEMGSYKLTQNYIWDNRGGFSRQRAFNEAEALLLSLPPESEPNGEARFVSVPPKMLLKKQKAQRLDINLETHALSVKYRDPSEQEAQEEHERMSKVLSDDCIDDADNSSMLVEYIDGEWRLGGRPPTSRDQSSKGGSSHAPSHAPSSGRRSPALSNPSPNE